MAVRVRHVTRTTQPQDAVGLDTSNPISASVIVAIPFGNTTVVGSAASSVTTGSNGDFIPSEFGKALNGGTSAAIASMPLDLSAYNAITVSALLYTRDVSGSDHMIWELTSDGLSTTGGFALYAASGGGKFETGHHGDVGMTAFGWAGAIPANGSWNHVAVVYDFTKGSTGEMRLFVNGVEKSASSWDALNENTSSSRFANSTLYFLNRTMSTLPTDAMMAGFCILAGDQSQYMPTLAANPWQLFEPEQIVVKAGAGAAVPSGVGSATLQRLSASGAGRHGVSGSASATLRPLSASGSGVRGQTGVAAATLPALSASGVGTHGYACAGLATLRPISVTASGVHGVTGAVSATLRAINAAAAGDFTFVGSIEGVGIATLHALTARGVGEHDPGTTDVGGFARPFPGRPGQGISRGIADDRDLLEMLPIVIGVMNHAGR